jgi:MtN3 and saliva related transmembrane protein
MSGPVPRGAGPFLVPAFGTSGPGRGWPLSECQGARMDWTIIVGTVGATASVASFTPQAWKIIKARSTEGLSLGMFALTTLAFLSWTVFGFLKTEWTLIVPNAICFGFALFILSMIALPRNKTAEVADAIDTDAD